MNQEDINKIMKYWREVLKNCDLLESGKEIKEGDTTLIGREISKGGEKPTSYLILLQALHWNGFWREINGIFEGKLHEDTTKSIVAPIVLPYSKSPKHNFTGQEAVNSLNEVYSSVQASIQECFVLIPIIGLSAPEVFNHNIVSLLPPISKNKDLQNILEYISNKESFSSWYIEAEKAECFLQVHDKGQAEYCEVFAKEVAESFLNLLQFYRAYHHVDIDSKNHLPKRRMGIIGQVPIFGINSLISYVKNDRGNLKYRAISEQSFIGGFYKESVEQATNSHFSLLLDAQIRSISDLGNNMDNRLYRSIAWFAKGTKALALDEAFISYFIALESLLSSDSKSGLQKHIEIGVSILLSQNDKYPIHPNWKVLASRDFIKDLNKTVNPAKRQEIIKSKMHALYKIRNDLMHGHRMVNESEKTHLLTLETLVRNTILAFAEKYVINEWKDFKDFEIWRNNIYSYNESLMDIIKKWLTSNKNFIMSIHNFIKRTAP